LLDTNPLLGFGLPYDPTWSQAIYDELIVFSDAQALPRYVVFLKSTGPASMTNGTGQSGNDSSVQAQGASEEVGQGTLYGYGE
jgi:hypothetical protein